jgi:hypothetical protein
MNGNKTSKIQFHFSGLLGTGTLPMLKNEKKIYNWTLEIIPFIRFENHNDGPRDLEFMGEYFNNYQSICPFFISHGCFTAGNMLKTKFNSCFSIWGVPRSS